MFERILTSVVRVLGNSLALEDHARRDGVLQRLDPRFVLLSLLALVVVTVGLHDPLSMVAVIVLAISLAAASRLPLGWYLKRVWLFVPLFTVVVLIPSMTCLFAPGHPVGHVAHLMGTPVYFTREGVAYAATFTLRVGAAVSLCLLIVATIEWSKLMRTLSLLHLPRAFVMTLDMTHRYIFLLLDSVSSMFMARRSRMVGRPASGEVKVIGSSAVATLLSKSLHMSEQVYLAMASRGFTGAPAITPIGRAAHRDYAFAALVVAFAVWLVLLDTTGAHEALVNLLVHAKGLI